MLPLFCFSNSRFQPFLFLFFNFEVFIFISHFSFLFILFFSNLETANVGPLLIYLPYWFVSFTFILFLGIFSFFFVFGKDKIISWYLITLYFNRCHLIKVLQNRTKLSNIF